MTNTNYLLELADILDNAYREGTSIDSPEGCRYIKISDTLARQISERLREYYNYYPPRSNLDFLSKARI